MDLIKIYVVRNKKTGNFINTDPSSGGYPYDVDSPLKARHWRGKQEADDYVHIFRNCPTINLEMVILAVSIEEITQKD